MTIDFCSQQLNVPGSAVLAQSRPKAPSEIVAFELRAATGCNCGFAIPAGNRPEPARPYLIRPWQLQTDLIADLPRQVIAPSEAKARELLA